MKTRFLILPLVASLVLWSCNDQSSDSAAGSATAEPDGFVRINSTIQGYNAVQPWDRSNPINRRGLGAVLDDGLIITTSEMVAKNVYLEIESADGTSREPAEVVVIDREANLALIKSTRAEESFVEELTPMELSPDLNPGDTVLTWQLKKTGEQSATETTINAVDIVPSYGGGKSFFSYLLKGSLQSSTNSFTLPIVSDGKLAAILTSYDSDEQISETLASSVIKLFLEDAADGEYEGFPSLGIAGTSIQDPAFRDWLHLSDEDGGIYVTVVRKGSSASKAGIEVGDVIVEVDGQKLDRKGYYEDETYGKLGWTHLIRGQKKIGETIAITLKREGELQEVTATLGGSSDRLVPTEYHEDGPQYLIKGGVIFQKLTKQYLLAYGKDWASRAPLNLLDVYLHSENYREIMDEAVVLTQTIPSQTTVGYEQVGRCFVEKVNGVEIRAMADLEKGFEKPEKGVHTIQLSEAPYLIYLNAEACDQVDQALLQQGLPSLKRIHE